MSGNPRQKRLVILIGILLVTNIITLAFLWSTRPHKDKHPQQNKSRMGQFMVDQLKFDSTQEAAYWALRDTLLSRQRPIMDSLRIVKKSFFDLLNYTPVNDSALEARSNAVLAVQKKLDLTTFRHFQQVRGVCRPEQYQKFDTVIKEIVTRMTTFRRPNNNKDNDSAQKK